MPQPRRMTRARSRSARSPATEQIGIVPAKAIERGALSRRQVKPPATAPGGRRTAKGTPKTPREPDVKPPAQLPPPQQDDGSDTEAMDEDSSAAGMDSDCDFYDEDASELECLPKDVRQKIVSMISTDAATLSKYRTVSKMFAHHCDEAVERFTINGNVRMAMFRHHLRGNDPTKLLWDVVGRFADSVQHLDYRDTPHLDDLQRISDYPQLRTLNLNSCWGLRDLKGLGKCAELREVKLNACTHLEDISELITCKQLKQVDMGFCMALKDVTVFDDCPELTKVTVPERLDETDQLAALQCRETSASRPDKVKYVKVIFN